MRPLVCLFTCATLIGCSSQVGPRQPLDGQWRLKAFSPFAPQTLTLTQHDSTVTGVGYAMGVDVRVSVNITGTVSLPVVVLAFNYGGGTARYTAMLETDSLLVGQAVYDASFNGGRVDSLTFARQ